MFGSSVVWPVGVVVAATCYLLANLVWPVNLKSDVDFAQNNSSDEDLEK
jgi:hypothetical protein